MKYKIKITDESEKKEINRGEDEIIEIKYNIGLAENTDFANNRSSIEMTVTGKVISNIENNTNSENNENNQNKKATNRRREFYDKKNLFLNKELTELENKMERIGIQTSSLSGVSSDKVSNFVDSVYRMAA